MKWTAQLAFGNDLNVRDYQQFTEKLRYIHRNPVKRGLVEKPEDWLWSSFCHYATGAPDPVEIESEWTAKGRPLVPLKKSPRLAVRSWGTRNNWGTRQFPFWEFAPPFLLALPMLLNLPFGH